ncbi:MAG: ornithine cyclodeaminase family protein [Reyranella sp.]|uniref:ornithine cyclodeaminase family protein n=1 Tax=Reyranella sp. TaxID=1929291 RepID=UPI001ACEEEFC|nr:ornithine cyclodeaminase family protein [Reyranella sp.]MBN9090379.1 ornithine cyclodeaminase family protein [Reyranella sp.]
MLLLSRADVARLMDFPAYVDAVEAGFRAAACGKALAPPATGFAVPGGSYHAKGAVLLGDTVAIKINANFPGNPASNGLPTVQGVIYLSDARNGRPLALMDSIEITINRTGAATTLAARHLARPDCRVAMICGAGVQGRIQLRAIAAAVTLERVHVWDRDGDRAERYAREMSDAMGLDVRPARDLAIARDAGIIVTCTSARTAFLTPALVSPGTFVAAVGADNRDKHEIAADLYAACRVTVDSLEQAAEIGDLHHALACGAVSREHVHATLAELVSRTKAGRASAADVTLFDSTGIGLQDVAAATAVYRRALAAGAGQRFSLA